jgi:DNA-directed RNA polymerase specialized sigma24 family protein
MPSRIPDELLDPKQCSALRLRLRLTRYAFACLRGRSWDDAEDIAQGAMLRAVDPEYAAWDRAEEPELFRYLAAHAKSILENEYRTQRRRDRREVADREEVIEETAEPPRRAPPHVRDFVARLFQELHRRHGEKDPAIIRLAELLYDGVDARAEQAKALSCSLGEVVFVRRRLIRKAKEIREDLERIKGEEPDEPRKEEHDG